MTSGKVEDGEDEKESSSEAESSSADESGDESEEEWRKEKKLTNDDQYTKYEGQLDS